MAKRTLLQKSASQEFFREDVSVVVGTVKADGDTNKFWRLDSLGMSQRIRLF